MNEDIPIEAILKYIKRDRDHYKLQAETVRRYAEGLEADIRALAAENKSLRDSIDSQKEKIQAYRDELAAVSQDVTQSAVYKRLLQKYNVQLTQIAGYRKRTSDLVSELAKYKATQPDEPA